MEVPRENQQTHENEFLNEDNVFDLSTNNKCRPASMKKNEDNSLQTQKSEKTIEDKPMELSAEESLEASVKVLNHSCVH